MGNVNLENIFHGRECELGSPQMKCQRCEGDFSAEFLTPHLSSNFSANHDDFDDRDYNDHHNDHDCYDDHDDHVDHDDDDGHYDAVDDDKNRMIKW